MRSSRLRHKLGRSEAVLRITDSRPVGRLIATMTRAQLVQPRIAYAVRELSGARRAAAYRLRDSGRVVHLRHNTTDAYTLDEVFSARIYEPPPAVDGRLDELGKALRIADLGANIGLFGVFALERWRCEQMLAFEPHPDNAELLRHTIAANRLGHSWRVIEACAFVEEGRLAFAFDHFSDSHALGAAQRADDGGRGNETVAAVDVFPLLGDTDLLKIDIEGGEWALLADQRFPQIPASVVAIEYHPHLAPTENARADATMALERAGYTVIDVFHDPRGHGMLWGWRTIDAKR